MFLKSEVPLPSQDPTVGLSLGPYGGPRVEGAVSYERATPVLSTCRAFLITSRKFARPRAA